jgi:hypothetical protein
MVVVSQPDAMRQPPTGDPVPRRTWAPSRSCLRQSPPTHPNTRYHRHGGENPGVLEALVSSWFPARKAQNSWRGGAVTHPEGRNCVSTQGERSDTEGIHENPENGDVKNNRAETQGRGERLL